MTFKKIVLFFHLLILPISAFSNASLLEGIWIIDHDLQKGVHHDLSENDRALFKCQSLKSYFTEGMMVVWQPKSKCGSLKSKLPVFGSFYNYSTVYKGKDTILLESKDINEDDKKYLDLIHFVNNDLFWIYPFSKNNDLHVRYYYKRVKSEDDIEKAKREIEAL